MKISNLLDKDIHIVEKKKIWFSIPAGIVLLAVILMIIFQFTLGSALNIGMDFAGGYAMDVRLGTNLTEANKGEYMDLIEDIAKGHNIKISSMQTQDSGAKASIRVQYKAIADEESMVDINAELQEDLNNRIFKRIPDVKEENGVFTAQYSDPVGSFYDNRVEAIKKVAFDNGLTVSSVVKNEAETVITATIGGTISDEQKAAIIDAFTIEDFYSGSVFSSGQVGAAVSSELLTTAICAIIGAIALMLFYIFIRFELASAISAVVALFHDILIMFCFMAIFHIEINSTFIAALITILGYSINNTIIIFDRVREAVKNGMAKNGKYSPVANYAVRDTMLRSLNTSITTLITIGMVAIIGVPDIRIFALPIIAGLLAGTYSSICIAPSIWSLIKDRKKRPRKAKAKSGKAAVA